MLISLFCLLTACTYYEADHLHPLTEDQKRALASGYQTGDTLSFLYTDSTGSDTQHFIVQPVKNYLSNTHVPDYGFSDYHEILEKELVSFNSPATIAIAVGNRNETYYYGDRINLYVSYKDHRYKAIEFPEADPAVTKYWLAQEYSWPTGPDSVELSYSTFSGIHSLEDSHKGYKLEKLP